MNFLTTEKIEKLLCKYVGANGANQNLLTEFGIPSKSVRERSEVENICRVAEFADNLDKILTKLHNKSC